MKNFEIKYILADGRTAATLKEVRQKLGCSGRAIRHLFEDGTIKKVDKSNLNVEHDGTTNTD